MSSLPESVQQTNQVPPKYKCSQLSLPAAAFAVRERTVGIRVGVKLLYQDGCGCPGGAAIWQSGAFARLGKVSGVV